MSTDKGLKWFWSNLYVQWIKIQQIDAETAENDLSGEHIDLNTQSASLDAVEAICIVGS